MLEKFSDRARKALTLAQKEASDENHEFVGTEHLLLGLLKQQDGVAVNYLRKIDIDYCRARTEIKKLVQKGPDRIVMGRLPWTPRLKSVIERAEKESANLGHGYIGTEHLLLALLGEPDGVAYTVLTNLGGSAITARKEFAEILSWDEAKAKAEPTFDILDKFAKLDTEEEDQGPPNVITLLQENNSLLREILKELKKN